MLGVLIALGLLFAYYAHAQPSFTPPIAYQKSEYSNFSYDETNDVIYKPNFAGINEFIPRLPPKKQTSYCSCVTYLKAKLGLTFKVGAARNWPQNSTIPQIGSVVITSESPIGHVALVTNVEDGQLTLDEANYSPCKKTTGRKLPVNSKLIKGYWHDPLSIK